MQTLYEVHTLKGGTWKIEATHKNRDSAIEQAKSIYGEKRHDGVKVIKDIYDPETDKSRESVIYDTSKPPSEKKAPPAPPPPPAAAPAKPKADVDFGGSKPARPKKKESGIGVYLVSMLWLVLILCGAVGVLWLMLNFTHFLDGFGIFAK